MKVNAVESFFFEFFYSNHKISVCLSQTHMYNEAHVSTCFYVLENLKQQQLGRAKWNSVFSKTTCIYFYLSFLYINGYRTEHVVYVLYDIGFRSARSNLMPFPLLSVKIIFFFSFLFISFCCHFSYYWRSFTSHTFVFEFMCFHFIVIQICWPKYATVYLFIYICRKYCKIHITKEFSVRWIWNTEDWKKR